MSTSVLKKTPVRTLGGFGWGTQAPENATIDYQRVKQYGNVVSIELYFHCTGNINANGNVLGSIYGVPLPPATVRVFGATGNIGWDFNNLAYTALDASTGEIIFKSKSTTDNYGFVNIEYIAEYE